MRDAAMAEAQSIVLIFDSLRTTQDALEERGTR
jgi:hypothetical protein